MVDNSPIKVSINKTENKINEPIVKLNLRHDAQKDFSIRKTGSKKSIVNLIDNNQNGYSDAKRGSMVNSKLNSLSGNKNTNYDCIALNNNNHYRQRP